MLILWKASSQESILHINGSWRLKRNLLLTNGTGIECGLFDPVQVARRVLAENVRIGGTPRNILHWNRDRVKRGWQLFVCRKVVVGRKIMNHPQRHVYLLNSVKPGKWRLCSPRPDTAEIPHFRSDLFLVKSNHIKRSTYWKKDNDPAIFTIFLAMDSLYQFYLSFRFSPKDV